jgi:hypothetical protein
LWWSASQIPLITQRSQVQILPPQPFDSTTYRCLPEGTCSTSPRTSPNVFGTPKQQPPAPVSCWGLNLKCTRPHPFKSRLSSRRSTLRGTNSGRHQGESKAFTKRQSHIPSVRRTNDRSHTLAYRSWCALGEWNMQPPRLIPPVTLNQKLAAQYCGVSYSSFRRWRNLPGFPKPCVISRLKLWRVVDLDAFIAANIQIAEVA